MEAASGPHGAGAQAEPRFITTLTFVHTGDLTQIEEAIDQARGVLGCGEERGMLVLDGRTVLAREREPIMEFNYGSESVYKNDRAKAWERGETWARPETAPEAVSH